jgi:hypothetical protein
MNNTMTKNMNYNFELSDYEIAANTVIVELFERQNNVDGDDFSISIDKVLRRTNEGEFWVTNPMINIPFGRVIKVSDKSSLGLVVGDLVNLVDEVGLVNENPENSHPMPFMVSYGFWLNPQTRNKKMTNMVQVPETLITSLVRIGDRG